jgi:hypothetical protein
MIMMNSHTIIFPFSATSILSPKSNSNYHISNTTDASFTANYEGQSINNGNIRITSDGGRFGQ